MVAKALPAVFLLAGAFGEGADYFPASDSAGGWRRPGSSAEIRRNAGLDPGKLDEAFTYVQGTTKYGGLLVVRHGWLALERYFGRGHREATPNSASIGKAFASIAAGVFIEERHDLFAEGLDQQVYTMRYLPDWAFPLDDSRKARIRLGQLLTMTAGIRGSSPGFVNRKPVIIHPPGPDGWPAMIDFVALRTPLWCDAGADSPTPLIVRAGVRRR
jgi:CubicO group peptidase (beta-lactamase class C family)